MPDIAARDASASATAQASVREQIGTLIKTNASSFPGSGSEISLDRKDMPR